MSKEIIRLASPVVVGMISHTILNIVDTAMVGRLGDEALGAVGLGSLLILVTVLVFGSLGIGTQAITSRRLGERRTSEFPAIAYSSLLLSVVVGCAVSVVGYGLSPWIFSLLSKRHEIVSSGTPYLEIRFLGLFSMVVIFTLRGFVYGLARVRIDMIVSLVINILNVILNYFLIFGHWIFPRLEIRGAALASIISTTVGLVVFLWFVHRRILGNRTRHEVRSLLSRKLMRSIVRISLPRAVQSLSILGFIVFLSFIGRIGVGELAISNIIFKAFNFSLMVGMAVGTASATLVGRSLGEGNELSAVRYGWHSVGIGALLMGIIGLLFMFVPREIMSIFTRSPETIEKGVLPFRMLGAFQFVDGVGIVLSRTLQGAGSTLYVMVSEMVSVWIVLVPFTFVSITIFDGNLVLAWWGLFLYITFFAAAMAWKFREGSWKKVTI